MVMLAPKEIESYKNSNFGRIPQDWKVLEAFDFSPYITSGSRGWARYYADHGAPFIRITNLSHDDIYPDLSDLRYVNVSADDPEAIRTRLEVGDILISITADIGAIGYVGPDIPKPAHINQHIACLRLPSDKIDSRFVAYFLSSSGPQRRFRAIVDVGAKSGLNLTTVGKLELLVPPTLKEQEAISEALSDADALIESLESLIAKKRAIKQGAMQELLREKKEHEIRPMKAVSYLKGRIGWQGLKQSEFTSNADEPFLITGMNFKDGEIRWDEVYHISEERYEMAPEIQLKSDDLLMTKDGTIGKVLYVDEIPYPGKASLNSHLLLFRPIRKSYDPKYLYYQLGSRRFKDFIELSKSDTTFFGLSQAAVGAYPVLLPPLKEQEHIAEILTDMDRELQTLDTKLSKARQIKQGMMQELLTGRVRLI